MAPTAPAFTADEVAFFAGEQVVTIQARAPLSSMQLMDGEIGEISALRQESVPLWLALVLKQRDKCRIVAPEWLHPEKLEETLAEERANADRFAPLPYHYLELAFQLLSVAEDDLEDTNRIRELLADIEDLRRAKLTRGLKTIDQKVTSIKLPNISATELNRIRATATGVLDSLRELGSAGGTGRAGAYAGSQGGGGGASVGGDGGASNERLQQALRRRRMAAA
jgi:GINS complex subunit 2